MDMNLALTFGAILALLVFSAFFSGSETALTAASRPRLHNLAQGGNHRAVVVNQLWHEREHLIGALLLGNNLVNILASALATSALIAVFGDTGVVYATLGMTALVLIFAEVLPKTYALQNADRAALAVAPVLRFVVTLLKPFSLVIQLVVRATLSVFGIEVRHALTAEATEEQLRGAIDLHQGEGEEERHEREMLRSILDLGRPCGDNVAFFSKLRCKLYIADFFRSLTEDGARARLDAGAFRAACSRHLDFAAETRFDLILAWDLFNYLELSEVEILMRHLERFSDRWTRVLALVAIYQKVPDQPFEFRVLADDRLRFETVSDRLRPAPRHKEPDLVSRMRGFEVESCLLLRHGMREYCFAHARGYDLPQDAPSDAAARV